MSSSRKWTALPWLNGNGNTSSYLPVNINLGAANGDGISSWPRPRTRRGRLATFIGLGFIIVTGTILTLGSTTNVRNHISKAWPSRPSYEVITEPAQVSDGVDWSQFAYTQYVTDLAYLCNSVMHFERLHRFGSKADRVMMYPHTFSTEDESKEAQLLRKSRDEYNVKLRPVDVQHKSNVGSKLTFWCAKTLPYLRLE